MDKQRAKEIRESENLINVTYNGDPIYIQSVNENNETASVYELENPHKQHQISIEELQER